MLNEISELKKTIELLTAKSDNISTTTSEPLASEVSK